MIKDMRSKRNKLNLISEGYMFNKAVYNKEKEIIDCVILEVNNTAVEIIGYKESDIVGKRVSKINGFNLIDISVLSVLVNKKNITYKYFKEMKSTKKLYKVVLFSSNKEGFFESIFIDVDDIRRTYNVKEKYELLYKYSTDSIIFIDRKYNIIEVNEAAEKTYGFSKEEFISKKIYELRKDLNQHLFNNDKKYSLENNVSYETIHITKSNETFPVEVRIQYLQEGLYSLIIRDITERKKYEQKLLYIASHDYLTDMYNRSFAYNQIEYELKKAKRYNKKFAILYIDIDNFKSFNDTFGHDVGDEVLKKLADILKNNTRDVDIAGRLGGDEFIVYVSEIINSKDVEVLVKRIISKLEKPIDIGDMKLQVHISIGISLFPDNGEKIDDLIMCSDKAMYEAKKPSGNSYKFFNY